MMSPKARSRTSKRKCCLSGCSVIEGERDRIGREDEKRDREEGVSPPSCQDRPIAAGQIPHVPGPGEGIVLFRRLRSHVLNHLPDMPDLLETALRCVVGVVLIVAHGVLQFRARSATTSSSGGAPPQADE